MSGNNRTVDQIFKSIAARARFIESELYNERSNSEKMQKVWETWRAFTEALKAFYGPRIASSIFYRTPKK